MTEPKETKQPFSCPYCDIEMTETDLPYCQLCGVSVFYCPQCRKPLSRDATGLDSEMVFNWALLLSREMVGEVAERIRKCGETYEAMGLQFQWSGPWPPYSFCPELGGGATP